MVRGKVPPRGSGFQKKGARHKAGLKPLPPRETTPPLIGTRYDDKVISDLSVCSVASSSVPSQGLPWGGGSRSATPPF